MFLSHNSLRIPCKNIVQYKIDVTFVLESVDFKLQMLLNLSLTPPYLKT